MWKEADDRNSKRKKSRGFRVGGGMVSENEKWNRLDEYPLFPVQAGVKLVSPRACFILLTVCGEMLAEGMLVELRGSYRGGVKGSDIHGALSLGRGLQAEILRGAGPPALARRGNRSVGQFGTSAQSCFLKKRPAWTANLAHLKLFPFTQPTPGL